MNFVFKELPKIGLSIGLGFGLKTSLLNKADTRTENTPNSYKNNAIKGLSYSSPICEVGQ